MSWLPMHWWTSSSFEASAGSSEVNYLFDTYVSLPLVNAFSCFLCFEPIDSLSLMSRSNIHSLLSF